MDPVGGDRRDAEAALRARDDVVRRSAARPARIRPARASPRRGRLSRGERAPRLDRGRRRQDRRLRLLRRRPHRNDAREGRPEDALLSRRRLSAAPDRARGRARLGQVRAERRRPDGAPGAAACEREAVLPGRVGVGVDDAPADHLRGRDFEAPPHRRLALPAALDLRRQRCPRRQERRNRLRALVARVLRPEHAVGRGRLAGARLRRGVGARAPAVPDRHGRLAKCYRDTSWPRARRSSSRTSRARTCS